MVLHRHGSPPEVDALRKEIEKNKEGFSSKSIRVQFRKIKTDRYDGG